MTALRARIKPSINALNKTLRRLEAKGYHSYRDNIRERAFMFKLRVRKPKS
jgi:hypothetical protein